MINKYTRGFCLGACILLGACTSGPKKGDGGPIFYPPLPNPPRLQHLLSISNLKDLGEENTFAEFVLGKKSNQALVNKPYGVGVNQGKLYVVDTRGGYVVVDLEKKKLTRVYGRGGGRMKKPVNITFDSDGSKYITDTGRDQILKFNAQDKFERAYGLEGQFKPADVAIVKNRMYVSDLKHHMIQVLDKQSGKLLFKMATADEKNAQARIHFPTNLAVYKDQLLVSDTGNFKINTYKLDGKFIKKLGSVGSGLGQFARPKGIATDREGQLYVVDAAFQNVQIFNKQGRLLLYFGGPGAEPDSINLPTDIFIDYDNVRYFQKYAAPGFKLEYVVVIASQFGVNKINIFGYGKMTDMDYSEGNQG